MDCKHQETSSNLTKKRKIDRITNDNGFIGSVECQPPDCKRLKTNFLNSGNIKQEERKVAFSFLGTDFYEARECGGEGNCLFHSISYQLPRDDLNTHQTLRQRACNYIETHISDFSHALKGLVNEETQKPYTPLQYVKEKRKMGEYGDEPEILALSKVLGRTIKVYTPSYSNERLTGYLLRSEYPENTQNQPVLLNFIYHRLGSHYQAIQPKEIPIVPETLSEERKIDLEIKTEACEDLNEISTYQANPVVKRGTDQYYGLIKNSNNRYNEILKFFQSGETKKTPQRLKTAKARKKWRIKTHKKYKYDVELDRILELKEVSYEYLSNLFPKPELNMTQSKYKCWYYIPFENEKEGLLKLAHNDLIHNGRDRMMTNMRAMGYNWANLTKDCQNYLSNCFSCPISTMQKVPSITTKQILEEAPRARYQIDTVLLAEDLQTTQIKYLITIEDHFSKYLFAATSKDKSAKSVHLALRKFFSLCGEPKILQCDNGKEFVNTIVEEYLAQRGIEFVHGRPYHPQSQGLIERANRTLQTALARIYHQQKNDFDLESSLVDTLAAYNNSMHSSTKIAPITAFKLDQNVEKDKPLLIWIRENLKKAFKNKITKVKYLMDQKILVFNAITKAKDQYLRKSRSKKKMTKGYVIPAIVVKVEVTHVVVKIFQKSNIVNETLEKNEEYKITLNLIQKANDKRWNMSLAKPTAL